ncbi:MAG: type II CAAX endopeptidase family protein [Deltaproteobacteria bacterium]|nr:type II CAAX endopeptidase family protein [Deltaproteobacteria bacterium]
MNTSLRTVYATIPAAFVLWFFIFAVPAGNFWLKLTGSASLLAAIGLVSSRNELKALLTFKIRHLWVGVLSALILYGIFWVGKLAVNFLFSFAPAQIESVYASKTQLEAVWIGLLLLFVMGPAEEIYWHGFVQRRLTGRYGATAGVLATAVVYTLVHAASLNFMLVAAAGVCGLYWGLLFQREKNLIPLIISHALWDFLIFVLFPMK